MKKRISLFISDNSMPSVKKMAHPGTFSSPKIVLYKNRWIPGRKFSGGIV